MKYKWAYFMVIFLGLMGCATQLLSWYHTSTSDYTTPQFEELRVNEGTLSFTPSWKNSGGQIVLDVGDNRKHIMTCEPPYAEIDHCFYKPGLATDFSNQLTGKQVTIWWEPISDTPSPRITGRIYQLKVGSWFYYDYAERANYYKVNLHRGEKRKLFFAAVFCMLTLWPLLKILRGMTS